MNARRATQRLAATAGFALAVIVLLCLMGTLSAWITNNRLIHDAQVGLATLRDGQPLWQWRLRKPSQLVASRVFGTAALTTGTGGLRVTSRDGTPFELGLPLSVPVDLANWPLLKLQLQSDAAGSLALSYQASASSQACLAANAARFAPDVTNLSVDVRALPWRTSTGAACPPPGVVAYMLRLRPQLPAGATLSISEVSLASAQPTSLPATIDGNVGDIRLPSPDWSDLALDTPTPLVRLPAGASPETMLLLRDQVRQRWPAALIVPFGRTLTALHDGRPPEWLDWAVCGIYLAWLCGLSLRQKPGVIRSWQEAAAMAAGPLWLIAGLRWGPQPSIPGIIAFLAAIAYGVVSEWRRRPAYWAWLGQRGSDWLWPLVPLPVAAALMLADGHGLTHLEPRHVLAYFGWALLQQWAVLAIVMGRLRHTGLPAPAIILTVAGVFGLLHTPNGSLMQLCLMAELWWAWCFMRSPRLVPIAVAHATCALLVESGLTGHLLRSLEVSARFFL